MDSPKIEIGILEFANQHHHPSGKINRHQSWGGIFKAACRPVENNAGAKNRNRVSKHFSPLRCFLQVVNCESYFFCRPYLLFPTKRQTSRGATNSILSKANTLRPNSKREKSGRKMEVGRCKSKALRLNSLRGRFTNVTQTATPIHRGVAIHFVHLLIFPQSIDPLLESVPQPRRGNDHSRH